MINRSEAVTLPPGIKTNLSTNSSLYSTPCQSPGSLGSSLDSTNISLPSKNSLTTTAPSENSRLLSIQQSSSCFNSRTDSRPNSCSSGSFSSVHTLLPPSSTTSSPSTWRREQIINNHCNQSTTSDRNSDCWKGLIDLKQDLTKRLFSLKQQVQSVVCQLNELEDTIGTKLDEMCQHVNGTYTEPQIIPGIPENCEAVAIPFSYEFRKSLSAFDELKKKRADQLINKPAIQKLPALVKGYLTRRIMTTSKVKDLIKTIKDTTILLDNYRSEEQVAKEEIDFHRRLMIQLEKSLTDFHDIFFTYSKSEQMKLISRSREFAIEKVFRLSSEARRAPDKTVKKATFDRRKDSPIVKSIEVKQQKQSPDVEMKPIEDVIEDTDKDIVENGVSVVKDPEPKTKAASKSRKGAKNARKNKETESTSTSTSSSTTKSAEEADNCPRRSKRAATTSKRATRGAKKSS